MSRQELIEIFNQHSPITQMSEDENMTFMNIALSKDQVFDVDLDEVDKDDPIYKQFKSLLDSFVPQVFLKRLEVMTSLKMTLGALIILLFHMESPGAAVMHTFYLHYKLPDNEE
jgi:hypothetical protein